MTTIKRLILMIQFLTRIPIKVNLQVTNEDFGKGLVFAPLVGLIIGSIMYVVYYIMSIFMPIEVAILISFVSYIFLTGGLHLDGLGDTFDGIFSNRPKDRILEIMRDSRIGTNALLAVVSVFLLNLALLKNLPLEMLPKALFLFPVAGRIGSLISSGISTYARSGEGLGKSFIDICGTKEIIQGSIIYFIIFTLVASLHGLLFALAPFICAFIITKFFTSKIDGATGDVLGAVCELNQVAFLFGLYIVLKFIPL